MISNYPIKNSESFDYRTKIIGSLGDNLPVVNNLVKAELRDIKIVIPLKNVSKFMFNLDILLTNAEIELLLKWSQNCVLTEMVTRETKAGIPGQGGSVEVPPADAINRPEDLKFNTTDCKLYVPVVTLQTEYQDKLYEELKTGISTDFMWTKCR